MCGSPLTHHHIITQASFLQPLALFPSSVVSVVVILQPLWYFSLAIFCVPLSSLGVYPPKGLLELYVSSFYSLHPCLRNLHALLIMNVIRSFLVQSDCIAT